MSTGKKRRDLLEMDVGAEAFALGARMVLMEALDRIAALEREIAELQQQRDRYFGEAMSRRDPPP